MTAGAGIASWQAAESYVPRCGMSSAQHMHMLPAHWLAVGMPSLLNSGRFDVTSGSTLEANAELMVCDKSLMI